MAVFLKPLVRKEMTRYVDGYGNKRDWKAYNKNLNVTKTQLNPNPEKKVLTFRALVTSEEERDPNNSIGEVRHKVYKNRIKKESKRPAPKRFIKYLVTVEFHDVKFRESESIQFKQKWKVSGKDTFSRVPTIEANPAMIKCQCRDFMFVWEKSLADNDGLWPDNVWTKYKRLTPKSVTPPRNPMEKMGYCKHIATFLQYLYDSELIRNA